MEFPPFEHAAWLGEAWRNGAPKHDLGASGFRSPRVAGLLPPVQAGDASHMDLHAATDLRAAIAAHIDRPEDEVRATAGTTEANTAAILANFRPGSTVVSERPTYMPLASLAMGLGARIRWVDRQADGGLDAGAMVEAIDSQVSLVLLTSPHNPTGHVASERDLRHIAEAASAVGAMVLVDQVYAELQDAPVVRHPSVMSTSGLNKCWGAPGLRIGWAAGSPEAMAKLEDAHRIAHLAVPAYGARAAMALLPHRDAFAADLRDHLEAAHTLYGAWCNDMDLPLTHAGLTTFVPVGGDTMALARGLLADGILTVPGELFGTAGFLRLGFGAELGTIEAGLDALQVGLRAQRF